MMNRKGYLDRRTLLAAAGSSLFSKPLWAARRFAPVPEEELLVAFGHTSPVTDGGWTHAHDLGVQAVRRTFPRLRTLFVESIPYSADATRIFRQFVAEGAQMVISTSTYGDFLRDVSSKVPDVAFMECDGNTITDNLGWYYIAHWNVSYVLGVAAARLSRTGKIGFIASFPVPAAFSGANATLMGARSVNPEATLRVISINSWFDPQAASEAASALIDNGCDFLGGVMDEPAYLRVAEMRGAWAAMWNTDMRRFGPNAYVSSVMLDFAPYYVEQVRARIQGTWQPQGRFLKMGQGVDRDAWGQRVPLSVQTEADAARTRILGGWSPFQGPIRDSEGHMRVPAGRTMTDRELYGWRWQVEGVSGLE